MKFLNTDNKLSIIESEDYHKLSIPFASELLDLPLSKFIEELSDLVEDNISNIDCDKPILFDFECGEGIEEDEIEYSSDLMLECLMDSLTINNEKKFKNQIWQPVTAIQEQLKCNMKAQTRILNYKSSVLNFNVNFSKNKKIIFKLIED